MFDHVTIRCADRGASQRFYDTVLGAAGIERVHPGPDGPEWGDFSIVQATDAKPPTRRLHVGFAVASRAHVGAFWRAGADAGYADDGAPGERPQYTPSYYGAFLLDPDGNSTEAVHHDGVRRDGNVDHLWLRVRDVAVAARFYTTIAGPAGLRLHRDTRERASFVPAARENDGGTFSLVPGEPTEHVHIAFPGDDDAVRAFHRTATSAGYRDNGEPGERPEYHPGYFAAFVLDPDGTNVEVVNHRRG